MRCSLSQTQNNFVLNFVRVLSGILIDVCACMWHCMGTHLCISPLFGWRMLMCVHIYVYVCTYMLGDDPSFTYARQVLQHWAMTIPCLKGQSPPREPSRCVRARAALCPPLTFPNQSLLIWFADKTVVSGGQPRAGFWALSVWGPTSCFCHFKLDSSFEDWCPPLSNLLASWQWSSFFLPASLAM